MTSHWNDDHAQSGPSHVVFHCRRCSATFANRRALYAHRMQDHVQRGSGFLFHSPYVSEEEPWKDNEANPSSALIVERRSLGKQRRAQRSTSPPRTSEMNKHMSLTEGSSSPLNETEKQKRVNTY